MHTALTVYEVSIDRDWIDWLVAFSTVVALVVAVAAFVFTAYESEKSNERIEREREESDRRAAVERQRQFDLQTLTHMVQFLQQSDVKHPGVVADALVTALIASLSPTARGMIPVTARLFQGNPYELNKFLAELSALPDAKINNPNQAIVDWIFEFEPAPGTDYTLPVTVGTKVTRELTEAIKATALQPPG